MDPRLKQQAQKYLSHPGQSQLLDIGWSMAGSPLVQGILRGLGNDGIRRMIENRISIPQLIHGTQLESLVLSLVPRANSVLRENWGDENTVRAIMDFISNNLSREFEGVDPSKLREWIEFNLDEIRVRWLGRPRLR